MKLSICIHQFFDQYLPNIKGASVNTIKSYRDTYYFFFFFAANYHGARITALEIDHLSTDLILAFLEQLEDKRKNDVRTRNQRLAALKSLFKMIRFMYPEHKDIADRILNIPQKRTQKKLIGFLYPEEILAIFNKVNLKKKEGFRDYALLHLLSDSGARASEIANLNIDDFDPIEKTLMVLGKRNRFRLIELSPKTTELLKIYIAKYRNPPKVLFKHRLFINQRKEGFTRHGINKLCKKHISKVLPPKRLKILEPVHCFRHSCAVRMITTGFSLTDVKNHLGHEDLASTMIYIHMDLSRKREAQRQFIKYTQSTLKYDSKIEELFDWENKEETLSWLDSL